MFLYLSQVKPLPNADAVGSSSQVAPQESEGDCPEIESSDDDVVAEPILEIADGPNTQAESTAGVAEKDPLVSSWQELKDPNTGEIYYYNSVTGSSQWDRPEELEGSVTGDTGTPIVNVEGEDEVIDAVQQVTSIYRRHLTVIIVY